jgi:fucose 4-O-acetylase-like acetyltransferase
MVEKKEGAGTVTTERRRVAELDVLKGIAIIGVLILHSSFRNRFSVEALAVQGVLARVFDWAVIGFFFASGCLYQRAMPFWTNARKKAITLILPFCFYNLIYNVIFAVADRIHGTLGNSLSIDWHWFLMCTVQSPGFQLYFLPYLFGVTILVSALSGLRQNARASVYVTLLGAIVLYYVERGYPSFSYGSEHEKLPLYLAAFVVGDLCKHLILGGRRASAVALAMGSGLLVTLVASGIPGYPILVPFCILAFTLAFPIAGWLKPLQHLGRLSGSLYVWHTPLVLPALTRFFAKCGFPSLCNLFASLVFAIGICLALRLVLDAIFQRTRHTMAPRWLVL